MTTFRPKNKSYYKGKLAKFLVARTGHECKILGTETFPAEQCQHRKSFTVTYIKFPNCHLTFMVRPKDVEVA
jgi:hypothetical protein